jgi:hypothetical protein
VARPPANDDPVVVLCHVRVAAGAGHVFFGAGPVREEAWWRSTSS